MNRVSRLLRPGLFTLSLLLLTTAPVHAGVIQIDFTASVVGNSGSLGAEGDEFIGLITIDLIAETDSNPSPEEASFSAGPSTPFARAVTFDLFPVGGSPTDEPFGLGLAALDITNSPAGDSLFVFARRSTVSTTQFSLRIEGSADLFSGDGELDQNLPSLESLLLSFDFDANPGIFSSRLVKADQGLPGETVLVLTSASISGVQQVPEPGQLGVLALGLFALRYRLKFGPSPLSVA